MNPTRKALIEKMQRSGFIDVTEAARQCCVSRSAIYLWIRIGAIKSRRIGVGRGRVFVCQSSIKGAQ